MKELTMQEKLDIVNSGGEIDQTKEHGSWNGIKIRKGKEIGLVVRDMNGYNRTLTVQFKHGQEEIVMNNMGVDPEYIHQYEWYDKPRKVWYKF